MKSECHGINRSYKTFLIFPPFLIKPPFHPLVRSYTCLYAKGVFASPSYCEHVRAGYFFFYQKCSAFTLTSSYTATCLPWGEERHFRSYMSCANIDLTNNAYLNLCWHTCSRLPPPDLHTVYEMDLGKGGSILTPSHLKNSMFKKNNNKENYMINIRLLFLNGRHRI